MNELCQRYQESFGEADLPEELVRHGQSCEACREFVQRQLALKQALPSWQTPQFSSDFALSVMSRVAEDGSQRRTLGDVLRDLFQIRLAVPLPVGALAGVLLVISLFLNYALWPQHQTRSLNGGLQTAENDNRTALTFNPAGEFTPVAIPNSNGTLVDSKGLRGPLVIPNEFLGAGAFLLVPIVDPSASYNERLNTIQQSNTSRGI